MNASITRRIRLRIAGRVQGVGFRPAVYRLARRLNLTGFVRNTTAGVTVEAQGRREALADFIAQLKSAPPPQAVIESLATADIEPLAGESGFAIAGSKRSGEVRAGMPPDLAICDLCRQELFEVNNRRFGYPFINCTDCGPRFSIIRALPYDRKRTTMKTFKLCPDCLREFKDPANRRFEAQPNACPVCGPCLRLVDAGRNEIPGEPLREARQILKKGRILAVKGIGGYHLCCDALSRKAVGLLRQRKCRPHKPFAVMFGSLAQVRQYCHVTRAEAGELKSVTAPIVILRRKEDAPLAGNISPDTRDVGAFLPYSPLHCLLMEGSVPLVMTSGNRHDEPIAINEDELENILGSIADAALIHNRGIARRADDSVVKISGGWRVILRRSRGFVPGPVQLPVSGPAILACGADMKNTVCLTRGDRAFMSAHIGDLDDAGNFNYLRETVNDFARLLEIKPGVIAHDLHPDYLSTRFALTFNNARLCAVQHHHAHIASCLAEHRITEKVIGIALDGTGYGADGTIWGGELLVADLCAYRRAGHFKPYPMPGGQQAILDPARMALSWIVTELGTKAGPVLERFLPSIPGWRRKALIGLVERRSHAPLTTSAGRLFDAVAALLGVADEVSYEGRAAIRLQTLADPGIDDHYEYEILEQNGMLVISFAQTLRGILDGLKRRRKPGVIAGMFHNTLAVALSDASVLIRKRHGLNRVALSGGVFQNDLLLNKLIYCLKGEGFAVYINELAPPNDGGIALGQAAVAAARQNFRLPIFDFNNLNRKNVLLEFVPSPGNRKSKIEN